VADILRPVVVQILVADLATEGGAGEHPGLPRGAPHTPQPTRQ
jgi:hypothetical protein